MKALLLAGGKGTRLWPLSQKETPKQIISPFDNGQNLLRMTVRRTEALGFEDIYLVTSEEQKPILQPFFTGEIIAEPMARNTAPAILLGAKKLLCDNTDINEAIYVFPSDHYIKNFQPNLAIDLKDMILCFRIVPTRPEAGYGYLQTHTGGIIRKVRLFTEKPNLQKAQEWYDSWVNDPQTEEGKYFWNAGIYAFSLKSLTEALQKINPELCDFWLNSTYEEFVNRYSELPSESFDVMIAEKAYNLHCSTLNADMWRDVGTWQSVYEALEETPKQNVHIGRGTTTMVDSQSCLVKSDKDLHIACAGVDNLAIIISGNQILIADKTNPQAMQDLINKLQDKDII